MRVTWTCLVAIAVAGCGQLLDNSALVNGTWQYGERQFESGVVFTLETRGNAITGNGWFNYEAMSSGTIVVTGYINAPDVFFNLTFSNGTVFAFRGTMPDPEHLSGTLARPGGPPVPVVFSR